MRSFLFLAFALSAGAATVIERFELVPHGPTVLKPMQSVAIQVKAYGRVESESGGTRSGRVEAANFRVSPPPNGGAVSKPFKFQGEDREPILRVEQPGWKGILSKGMSQFVAKDSVLFTAPLEPGKYEVKVNGTGAASSAEEFIVEFDVAGEPQPLPGRTFPPETKDGNRFRALAEHYAPFIAQETWFDPRADMLCRFDFDGDHQGDNNWDNLEKGSPQAYVYYAVIETATHWFVQYNFFHARDYSDNCIAGTCHENDNEGVILTVRRDGSEFGRLDVMETLAHNNVYSYTNNRSVRPSLHNVDGALELFEDQRPIVFLEAGGHGAIGSGDRKSTFNGRRLDWKQFTGITYRYRGLAQAPKGNMDREVGYELLPIEEHWWKPHLANGEQARQMFADYYNYEPVGNRPRPVNPRIAGAFLGRKHDANKARPFWGWFDMKGRQRRAIATGQWALDPAYSITRSVRLPTNEPVSLDYTYNPYLGIGVGDGSPR
jgi:hypothetical protein